MLLICPRTTPRPPGELCSAPRQEVPASSTTGSSSCSVGRLLWLVRLPTYRTSQESPGRSNPATPLSQTSPNRRLTITLTTASVQGAQEKMPSLKWTSEESRLQG